jgi:bacterial/archaeal transporter family-2 protein
MRFLLIILMIAAGFCIAIQGAVNSRLRLAVESPVLSSAISFLSGGIVLVCLMATGAFGGTGTAFKGMETAPPWAFLGGVLGIGYVSKSGPPLGGFGFIEQYRCAASRGRAT